MAIEIEMEMKGAAAAQLFLGEKRQPSLAAAAAARKERQLAIGLRRLLLQQLRRWQ